jgi:hypothetical protein
MRVGITGHRGLADKTAEMVREAIRGVVNRQPADGLVGVSCIAEGPDAWFAQAVLEHGGRLEVVVPALKYRETLPQRHRPIYDELIGRASEVHQTGLSDADPHAYMVGSEVLVGLADQLIAVWDGGPAHGYGGTADVVSYALRTGIPVRVVWPQGASRD